VLDRVGQSVDSVTATTLPPGGTATFTVRPKAGLPVGVYNETIAITGAGAGMQPVSATVTASFTVSDPSSQAYAITIAPSVGGTVIADRMTALAGETVALTVTPDEGYELVSVSVVNCNYPHEAIHLSGTGLTRSFVMPVHPVSVVAVFR
jgi:hypothetical protein